jgi:small subunit ribosomal protein S20
MPTSRTAKKRVRQNDKRRLRHKARRSEIKTLSKKLATSVLEEKDAKKGAAEFLEFQRRLDKAAQAHTIHANTVARKKSRLQRKLNKLAKAAAGGQAPKA